MARLSLLLLIIWSVDLSAQNIAEGVVVNKITGKPIHYVNVFLKKKSSVGTISNIEGKFKLRYIDHDSVIFSHIGFKRKAISTQRFSQPLKVELEEAEKMLAEVVIMPDSSLLQLLRKAYKNIETNYPSTGTLSEGFFRETTKVVEDDKFLFFGESTIEFYKPGYSNRHFGRVKLIKGAKSEAANRLKYSNVYYYSGVYVPQTFDFVKQRDRFIHPDYFKEFNYTLARITKEGDHEIMEIEFKPKPGSCCVGSFQLDRKTLAYMGIQYNLTKAGLNDARLIDFSKREYKEAIRDIRYREIDGVWNLSAVIIQSKLYNPAYKNHTQTTREFVATSITPMDHDPIKDSEAITFNDIYSQQEEKFNNDYWKDSVVISRDSSLQKQVNLLFNKEDLTIENEAALRKEISRTKSDLKFLKFMARVRQSISVGVSPITITPGLWSANGSSKEIRKKDYVWISNYQIAFKFNHSFLAFAEFGNGLFKDKDFSSVAAGLQYEKIIAGWRRPLKFRTGVGVGQTTVRQPIAKKTLIGQKAFGVMPSLELSYSISPAVQIFTGVTVQAVIKRSDKLLSGFSIDGQDQSISGIALNKTPTFLRVGVSIGLN